MALSSQRSSGWLSGPFWKKRFWSASSMLGRSSPGICTACMKAAKFSVGRLSEPNRRKDRRTVRPPETRKRVVKAQLPDYLRDVNIAFYDEIVKPDEETVNLIPRKSEY